MATKGKHRGSYKKYEFDPKNYSIPKSTKYNRIRKFLKGKRFMRSADLLHQYHQQQMIDKQVERSLNNDTGARDNYSDTGNENWNNSGDLCIQDDSFLLAVNEDESRTLEGTLTSSLGADSNTRECDSDTESIQSHNSNDLSIQNHSSLQEINGDVGILSQYSKVALIRILIILSTKMRHNGTFLFAEHMSEAIEALSDSPQTPFNKHDFEKIIDTLATSMSVHHFCNICKEYAGKQEKIVDEEEGPSGHLICINCTNEIDMKNNWKMGNVFLYFSLKAQLQEFFSKSGNSILYRDNRTKESSFTVEDIFDGKMYKQEVASDSISINFSFDGVPIFNSSNYSMHPICCTINELPPEKRQVTVFLTSLYCGTGKVPNVNAYLVPFIAESNELNVTGFQYKFQGQWYEKKCQILLGICDSVARRELRNCTQFNGKYGCGFCKHPGEQVSKGRGSVRVYKIDEAGNPFGEGLRTHEETLIHAQNLEKGIRGKSALCDIKHFDIIKNLPPEWQHSVALGVVRQFTNLWFNSNYHNEPFYCGTSLSRVDDLMLSFKPTLDVSRTPRKISDRSYWKAHEWVVFLLFYSIPIVSTILPIEYINHWALLVDGISILIGKSMMLSDIYYADQCFIQFIQDIEKLYGKEHISYNVHLLPHLVRSVLDWGPLWTHSAFAYENYYQTLLAFIHSSNTPSLQICHSFRLRLVVQKLYDLCSAELTEMQKKYVQKMLLNDTNPKVTMTISEGSLLGNAKIATLRRQDFIALQRNNVRINSKAIVKYFDRMILNGEIIHTVAYTRPVKRQSFYVLLKDSEIFQIERFVVFGENQKTHCYALGFYFQKHNRPLIRNRRFNYIFRLEKRLEDLAAVNVDLVEEKVMFIERTEGNLQLACKFPNHCELLT